MALGNRLLHAKHAERGPSVTCRPQASIVPRPAEDVAPETSVVRLLVLKDRAVAFALFVSVREEGLVAVERSVVRDKGRGHGDEVGPVVLVSERREIVMA